jgi:hypothetical protein
MTYLLGDPGIECCIPRANLGMNIGRSRGGDFGARPLHSTVGLAIPTSCQVSQTRVLPNYRKKRTWGKEALEDNRWLKA